MSTPYDYITINGTSVKKSYEGTQIEVNGSSSQVAEKMAVTFFCTQNMNGYSYPWPEGASHPEGAPSQNRCAITGKTNLYLYKRYTASGSQQNSYSKSFGTTVYGGTFDYRSGILTVTHIIKTLNSSMSWTAKETTSSGRTYIRFSVYLSDCKNGGPSENEALCTHFRWDRYADNYLSPWGYYFINSSKYMIVSNYNNHFETLADFTAWLDAQEANGTPVQIVYPLSTSQTITLSTSSITFNDGATFFDCGLTSTYNVSAIVNDPIAKIRRPSNFAVQREDIYAGEYTTCTGATKADRIGWKYSDLDLEWDALEQSSVEALIALTGQATLIFDDPEQDTIQESIVRSSAVATRHRSTLNGVYWWTDVKCSIRFIDAHND